MLSATAEFLLGSLQASRGGLCPICAAKLMGCTREDMVKATKELILHGAALAYHAECSSCREMGVAAFLRPTSPQS